MTKRICSVQDCSGVFLARGMCAAHYKRWRLHGEIGAAPIRRLIYGDDKRRFFSYVDKSGATSVPGMDPCWLWTGNTRRNGYGIMRLGSSDDHYAHRLAHMWFVGEIPDGYDVDHLCRVRSCVNPSHLEAVTHRTNCLRGVSPAALNAVKTHCHNDHIFDTANTYINRNGGRECRACGRDRARASRAAKSNT